MSASRITKGFDPTVVLVSTAVKSYLTYPSTQGSLGYQSTDKLRHAGLRFAI